MLDFYERYWLPFAEVLSDMEMAGVPVNCERLDEITSEAAAKQEQLSMNFRRWVRERLAAEYGSSAVDRSNLELLNPSSCKQIAKLFFGSKDSPPEEFVPGRLKGDAAAVARAEQEDMP